MVGLHFPIIDREEMSIGLDGRGKRKKIGGNPKAYRRNAV